MAEHILIPLLAGAQNHQLDRVTAQIFHHILDQVKALLVCQPGHDADHHPALVLLQTQLSLESNLVLDLLLAEILRVINLLDHGVRSRVKVFIVNTVDDTTKAAGAGSHKAVKALAVKRHLDLLRVGVAHSGNGVRKYDAAL